MTFVDLLLHPVNLVVYQVVVTALVLSFTIPSSVIRPAVLPLIALAAWLIATTCVDAIPQTTLASVVAGNGPTYLLRYLDLVLLSRWSYEAAGPVHFLDPRCEKWQEKSSGIKNSSDRTGQTGSGSRSGRPQGTAWERFRFGLNLTLSSRQVNTPCEVKNVPHFSPADPRYVPSRGLFLRQNAIAVVICYFVVDIFSLGVQPEKNAVLFSSQNVPFFARLGNVSAKQVAVRIASTFSLWLNVFCITQMGYGILALVAVGTGLSQVSAWRPPFGRLADAYTVRRFWGNSWHQMLRQPFSSPANFFVDQVLHLSKYRLIARYTKIFGTFFVSGLLHMAVDVSLGMSLSESGSVRFFCTQALGIMLEDIVQVIDRSARGGSGKAGSQLANWTRALGYVWVVAFLSWSTPVWAYPAIRMNKGEAKDAILPFSIVRMLLQRGKGHNRNLEPSEGITLP